MQSLDVRSTHYFVMWFIKTLIFIAKHTQSAKCFMETTMYATQVHHVNSQRQASAPGARMTNDFLHYPCMLELCDHSTDQLLQESLNVNTLIVWKTNQFPSIQNICSLVYADVCVNVFYPLECKDAITVSCSNVYFLMHLGFKDRKWMPNI